jgi:uncharacterized protein (TIGR02996 family)
MTTAALRQAWAEWRAFADGLDLSDEGDGRAALHGRLSRLCGGHPFRADHLRAVRRAVRDALEPWLGPPPAEGADDLERLRVAVSACEPAWRALTGATGTGPTDWDEVERVVRAAGLAWPRGPFWSSPLFGTGRRFEPVTALRGRDQAEASALLLTLLRVVNHPHAGPLWDWLRGSPTVARPAEALRAAAVLAAAAASGALRAEWLGPLPWLPPPAALLRLVEDVCLGFLRRLNEPPTLPARPAEPGRRGSARPAPYRRAVPDPLPVEPYFRDLPGSEAFLRAIAEEPLEDSHRLVFADWLDEQGQAPRAAFIRLQCEAEALPRAGNFLRRRLDEQIKALFEKHAAAWVAGLPPLGEGGWGHLYLFRRGMLEHVRLPGHVLTRDALAAVDVRGVEQGIRTVAELRTLLARPWFGRLASLDLHFPSGDRGVTVSAMRALAASARLGHLGLEGSCLGGRLVTALLEALPGPGLASLDLTGNNIGAAGVRALAGSAVLGGLRVLRLGGNQIGLDGAEALAGAPAAAGLTVLGLASNYLPPQAAEALANSAHLGGLADLDLHGSAILDRGVTALARSPVLRLTGLGLAHADLGPKGARELARSPGMASLAFLDLFDDATLGDAGVQALAGSARLSGLRGLTLYAVRLTGAAFRALAGSPHLANLEALDLSHTDLDEASALALAASPHLGRLRALSVYGNGLSRTGRNAVRKRWRFAWL